MFFLAGLTFPTTIFYHTLVTSAYTGPAPSGHKRRWERSAEVLNKAYTGTPETVLEIFRTAYGEHGAKSWRVRKYVENVIRGVRSRDYWSEALAVYYDVCSPRFRYTHDPQQVELVKSPEKMVYEVLTRGVTLGDCDDLTGYIIAGLSVVGTPARLVTGAFDYHPELEGRLGNERPERFGFSLLSDEAVLGPFSHVWAEGLRPDGVWVVLDPVAGPHIKQMRRRLKQIRHYTLK